MLCFFCFDLGNRLRLSPEPLDLLLVVLDAGRAWIVEGKFDESAGGIVMRDGIARDLKPDEVLLFQPSESMTLMPGDWHAFWGKGRDLVNGEVSTVNDDLTNIILRAPIGRFSEIDEDTEPTHLLVSDYDSWLC